MHKSKTAVTTNSTVEKLPTELHDVLPRLILVEMLTCSRCHMLSVLHSPINAQKSS